MRNIIFILSLFLLSLNANAQTIIPINGAAEYLENNEGNVPKHKYFKDVNGDLDNYVGTWEGTYDNKTYVFEITKYIKKSLSKFNPQNFFDGIEVDFKITDNSTQNVLYDKQLVEERHKVNNLIIRKMFVNSPLILAYTGDRRGDIDCGDIGDMYLKTFSNNNKMRVYVSPDSFSRLPSIKGQASIYPPCPDGRIYPPFPDNESDALILTKVTSQQPSFGN